MTLRSLLRAAAFATLIAPPGELSAQSLPAGPIRAFDGHVVVTGEITATFGDEDDIAFFNYTDYEHNVLRMFRLALSAAWRPTGHVAIVGEIRSEDLEQVRAFAAYVRVRPWLDHEFDIQVGRIPPTFGAFGRRAYATDNPLIGYPLAYQYLTLLRPDAVPATAEDLRRMRARGWSASYPVGSQDAGPGVPLITAFRWDTGVQARWSNTYVETIGAVTVGTLSDPQLADNNTGPQVSGRVAVHPATGLVVGGSAARGEWLSSDVKERLPGDRHYPQTALGADVEYSRSYWLVRSELVWSRWRVPFAIIEPAGSDLDALGVWVEGRYRITPRVFAAARADHLGFSTLQVGVPRPSQPEWDSPVTRFEIDLGYYLQRNLVARAAVQYNDRDAGRVTRRTYFAGQLSYWF